MTPIKTATAVLALCAAPAVAVAQDKAAVLTT